MFDLTGRTALVTGASGGIGGAIARALHGQGAVVALSGTRVGPLEALAADLGERAHVLPCDLSDAAAVEALPGRAAEAMGSVGVLVNNAGITRDQLMMRMSDEDWARVIEVNLTSVMRLTRGVLRGMMKARAGRIVNISSVVGVTGNPGQANYVASKAGRDRHVQGAGGGGGEPGDHGELRGAGLHRERDDRGAERRAEGAYPRADSGGADGHGRGGRGGGGLARLGGGGLRHRADAARQWRDGDGLTADAGLTGRLRERYRSRRRM